MHEATKAAGVNAVQTSATDFKTEDHEEEDKVTRCSQSSDAAKRVPTGSFLGLSLTIRSSGPLECCGASSSKLKAPPDPDGRNPTAEGIGISSLLQYLRVLLYTVILLAVVQGVVASSASSIPGDVVDETWPSACHATTCHERLLGGGSDIFNTSSHPSSADLNKVKQVHSMLASSRLLSSCTHLWMPLVRASRSRPPPRAPL